MINIRSCLARHRPDTQRLGPHFETCALDLDKKLLLAVSPHAQRRAGDQLQQLFEFAQVGVGFGDGAKLVALLLSLADDDPL